MSGIAQADIFIKLAIELGLEDIRKNPWLIDHMLSDLIAIDYASEKYGQKQIDACKEFLKNNQIDIYLKGRQDSDRLPCITITLQGSQEKQEMRHMADQSTEKIILLPNQIGKPIPYVIKPFTPIGYDDSTGLVSVDPSLDISGVSTGMILVNPANGTGYAIQDITPDGIFIESGLEIQATQFGIVPQFQYYEARIEHSFFDESYVIGCHCHGDPQTILWLWSIVKYSLLRYRESLLEANGFTESHISSSAPDFDENFTTAGGETAWSRFITLNCMVENTWIKSPRRFLETIALKTKPPTNGFSGGIRILSNLDTPESMDQSKESWVTTQSLNDEDENT